MNESKAEIEEKININSLTLNKFINKYTRSSITQNFKCRTFDSR